LLAPNYLIEFELLFRNIFVKNFGELLNERNTIKTRTIISYSIFVLLVVLLGYLFANTLALLAVSILLAMIFNPVVDLVERQKVPRVIAVLLVFLFTIFFLFSIISLLLPRLISQLNQIGLTLTEEKISSTIGQIELALKSRFPFLNSVNLSQKVTTVINSFILGSINNLSEIIYNLFSIVAVLIIVPFMTFFILKDNQRLMHGIINIMPNRYFEFAYNVIAKISFQLSRYVRGWILDATIVGILAGSGLALLGINNAVSIGFIAGIGHLIPYFGPVIGGLPAIIITVMQFGDFAMLPSVVILFSMIYTLDNGFIQPHIFAKSTDMHPLIIIVLILVGSETLGLLGMLIAIPIATIIKTAVKEIYFGYKNYKIISI
jgi:predicted PurR-regulated permease PerM